MHVCLKGACYVDRLMMIEVPEWPGQPGLLSPGLVWHAQAMFRDLAAKAQGKLVAMRNAQADVAITEETTCLDPFMFFVPFPDATPSKTQTGQWERLLSEDDAKSPDCQTLLGAEWWRCFVHGTVPSYHRLLFPVKLVLQQHVVVRPDPAAVVTATALSSDRRTVTARMLWEADLLVATRWRVILRGKMSRSG
jgi:hypothetical protein